MKPKRFTIDEFREAYPNDSACLDKLFKLRFGSVTVCPSCSKSQTFRRVLNRRSYQCPACSFQIYPTAGTVFEKTSVPLHLWFHAIYLQTTTRNGVAAKELERQLNVCYKTALRIAHQIKKLMALRWEKFSGIVEMDETFIGGSFINMPKWKRDAFHESRTNNKMPVFTVLERETGKIYTKVLDARPSKLLIKPLIKEAVEKGAVVMTDDGTLYEHVSRNYIHHAVNHKQGEYARKGTDGVTYTTNTVEGFFSLLKRTIRGTHISVSRRHLPKYVDEVAFRYYHRNNQDTMFDEVLLNVVKVKATA